MTRYPSTDNLYGETILEPGEARTCPFCGVQPVIKPWHGGAPTKHMVSCVDDHDEIECPVSPCVTGETRAEALERWNRREPTPTAMRASTVRKKPGMKASKDVQYCNACRQAILWETIGGTRVYRNENGLLIHNTQCGCGQLQRYANGEAVS